MLLSRLAQIAKKKWLLEGDQNSKFYHAVVNQRRSKTVISQMKFDDGRVLESPKEVHLGVVEYFRESLTQSPILDQADFTHLLSCSVSMVENNTLCMAPSEEEIKEALIPIPRHSSPSLDGFGSAFFIASWDIVKADIVEAATDFFQGAPLPRYFSSSYIVLIPKVQDPTNFDKLCPISLCSVAYKIFSKIIVKRLTRLLPVLISMEQGAFVPRMSNF